MTGKFPVNKSYGGKYSGSAGRSYSSSRASMSRGGGGKGPVNKGSGGSDKKGCWPRLFTWFVLAGTSAVGTGMMIDSMIR